MDGVEIEGRVRATGSLYSSLSSPLHCVIVFGERGERKNLHQ